MKKLTGYFFPKQYTGVVPEIGSEVELTVVSIEDTHSIINLPPIVLSEFLTTTEPIQVTFTMDEQGQIHYVSHLKVTYSIAHHVLEWIKAPNITQWAE